MIACHGLHHLRDHFASAHGHRRGLVRDWWASSPCSKFCRVVVASLVVEAAVSSSEAACSSVREDKSALPMAICAVAEAIDLAAALHLTDDVAQLVCMAAKAVSNERFG